MHLPAYIEITIKPKEDRERLMSSISTSRLEAGYNCCRLCSRRGGSRVSKLSGMRMAEAVARLDVAYSGQSPRRWSIPTGQGTETSYQGASVTYPCN